MPGIHFSRQMIRRKGKETERKENMLMSGTQYVEFLKLSQEVGT